MRVCQNSSRKILKVEGREGKIPQERKKTGSKRTQKVSKDDVFIDGVFFDAKASSRKRFRETSKDKAEKSVLTGC